MVTRSCRRVCSEAQRTVKSLRLATEVLRREGMLRNTFDASGQSCESLKVLWSEWTSEQVRQAKGENARLRLSSSFKGMKTLFDEPCFACDLPAGVKAVEDWARRALDQPQFTPEDVLSDIKTRVRWYMGTKWWTERSEGIATVPDQKGCAENERRYGGTLSVLRHWEPSKPHPVGDMREAGYEYPKEEYNPTRCRIGTAKSKSKMRIVTMQAARAKRILRPVHAAAYDHLSRQPWLVRGDVKSEHFEILRRDLREGEYYTSGDFEASTDNLNKDAVLAVVEVLCEALPERRKKVLMATFEDSWIEWEGKPRLIVRGSMMGNLLSFVVLCLLNKICLDRARQKVENCGPVHRAALVNGDDLFFVGSDEVRAQWLRETSLVGFVINRKKTMVSRRYGDLNSSTYDFKRSRFVPRLKFGFLGTEIWKEPDGTTAECLFALVKQLKFSTAAWLLNTRAVQSIFTRVVPPISAIPRRWWGFLVKKSWFRRVFSLPESEPDWMIGEERKLPLTLGLPLLESSAALEKQIARLERKITRHCVKSWRGELSRPLEVKRKERALPAKERYFNHRLSRGEPVWRRLWFRPIYEEIFDNHNHLLANGTETWIDEQPGLTTHLPLKRSSTRPLCFAPSYLLLSGFISELTLDGTVLVNRG